MVIDARTTLTLRLFWRLVGIAGAVLLLALFGAARAQAAITDIQSAGPLTDVYIGDDLTCQVAHTGDENFEFYSPGSTAGHCETDVSVGSADNAQLFQPGSWTPVSQSAISGDGSARNPFSVTTTVQAVSNSSASPILTLAQTDTYVVGNDYYRTDMTLTNNTAEPLPAKLYHAADCYLQGSDSGFGFVDTNTHAVACAKNANDSPPDLIEEFAPLTGGSNYYESFYGSIFSVVNEQMDFPNTCDCTTQQDNGMGINWTTDLAPAAQQTFSMLSNFSNAGVLSPAVTAISPASGPSSGGTSVTITGTNLTGANAVSFGSKPASSFMVDSDTQITATAPAGTGTVDVTVTTPSGASSTVATDKYTYTETDAPVLVSSVTPSSGPTAGGTSVTITGTSLANATDVKFGANSATITSNTATQIVATAPAGVVGTVDITVTAAGGTSSTGPADRYSYAARPAVTAINPTSGPTAGGTSVTITGTSLANATDVKFGANSATITSNTATQIVATAPAGVVGTVDITVTAAGGTSSTGPADRYSYAARPAVTAINPTSGPTAGGTSVTITGTSLANATDVKFGANSATITSNTATQIVATAPAGVVGTVDITVTAAGGTSSTGPADRYSYAARPAVTAINPTSGPTAGGTSVTITGTSLANATDVKFGANSATITSNTATQIVATAPAGVVGTVDITVTAAGGTSSTGPADRYSYMAPPPPPPPTTKPSVLGSNGSSSASAAAGFTGDVNPGGLATTAHFDYGLDSRYTSASTSGPVYDQSTPNRAVGSDFSSHPITESVSGLVPNALYHVRLVATNSAGTTLGPDVTFTTPKAALPSQPSLGKSFNVSATGLVLILMHGQFVPLTQLSQVPNGTIINALHGTLTLNSAATGETQHATLAAKKGKGKKPGKTKTQTGKFGGAVFKVTQTHSGLATLSLVEEHRQGSPQLRQLQDQEGQSRHRRAIQ